MSFTIIMVELFLGLFCRMTRSVKKEKQNIGKKQARLLISSKDDE
jgi:hypothetical protein